MKPALGKLLFITVAALMLGFIGVSCACPHGGMSQERMSHENMSHENMEMSAAHMADKSQDLTSEACAHGCADKMAAEQNQAIPALQSGVKLPPLKFAAIVPDWQDGVLAFPVNTLPVRRYFYAWRGPPDTTPVTLKTRLLT